MITVVCMNSVFEATHVEFFERGILFDGDIKRYKKYFVAYAGLVNINYDRRYYRHYMRLDANNNIEEEYITKRSNP
jgi:hypothetical protein